MKKGFTLIELLVVIAVLGVLAAGVMTAINPIKRIQQAQDSKIKNDIGQIAQAEQAYFTTNATATTGYAMTVRALVDSKDLKSEPRIPPGNTTSYSITGVATTDITVYGALTEPTTAGAVQYWCWESSSGKAGKVAAAPAVDATSCGSFL